MSIGDARKFLKKYLSDRLRIDKWGLSLPDSLQSSNKPTSIGLDKPALDINIVSCEGWGIDKTCKVETTIPFQIIYRFSSAYQYNDIPRAEAETFLTNVLIEANEPSCLPTYILSLKPSGSVSVAEHKNGDQLLIFEFDFQLVLETNINECNNIF